MSGDERPEPQRTRAALTRAGEGAAIVAADPRADKFRGRFGVWGGKEQSAFSRIFPRVSEM